MFVISTSNNPIYVDQCTFLSNLGVKHLVFVTSNSGDIKMSNVNVLKNPCAFISAVDSVVYLTDSLFLKNNCSERSIGCIATSENSLLVTRNVKIYEIEISVEGTLFYVINGKTSIFEKNLINTIYVFSKGIFMLADSFYQN